MQLYLQADPSVLLFYCFTSTIQTAVLSMMYITILSSGLGEAGIAIHLSDSDMDAGASLLFPGGFLAAVGWVS